MWRFYRHSMGLDKQHQFIGEIMSWWWHPPTRSAKCAKLVWLHFSWSHFGYKLFLISLACQDVRTWSHLQRWIIDWGKNLGSYFFCSSCRCSSFAFDLKLEEGEKVSTGIISESDIFMMPWGASRLAQHASSVLAHTYTCGSCMTMRVCMRVSACIQRVLYCMYVKCRALYFADDGLFK